MQWRYDGAACTTSAIDGFVSKWLTIYIVCLCFQVGRKGATNALACFLGSVGAEPGLVKVCRPRNS